METAAGGRTSAMPLHATHVCRKCREPVRVQGGKAVHSPTNREAGPDGHVAAPIEASLLRAAAALRAGAGS
jgi:hypothetical protein